jgi:hypothetical protein
LESDLVRTPALSLFYLTLGKVKPNFGAGFFLWKWDWLYLPYKLLGKIIIVKSLDILLCSSKNFPCTQIEKGTWATGDWFWFSPQLLMSLLKLGWTEVCFFREWWGLVSQLGVKYLLIICDFFCFMYKVCLMCKEQSILYTFNKQKKQIFLLFSSHWLKDQLKIIGYYYIQ